MRRAVFAAVAAAVLSSMVSLPARAQDGLGFCTGKPILECLAGVATKWSFWTVPDISRMATAVAMADWRYDMPDCDTLQAYAQQSFPAADRVFAPASDSFPSMHFIWATFKQDPALDTINGFFQDSPNGLIHYVVIRDNWDIKLTLVQRKRMLLTAVLHELGHSAGYDHPHTQRVEQCAKRNLTKEAGLDEDWHNTIRVFHTNSASLDCITVPKMTCRMFVLVERPESWIESGSGKEVDDDTDDSDEPWCGVVAIEAVGHARTSVYACTGEPMRICYLTFQIICRNAFAPATDGVLAGCRIRGDPRALS